MAATEELDDVREELRKNLGPVYNHCPFGCGTEILDEHGYCDHLVGFTNDPRIGGVVEPIITHPVTELKITNGRHKRKTASPAPSNEAVQQGDKLINPEEVQAVNGVRSLAKRWVSTRVYRRKVQKPA